MAGSDPRFDANAFRTNIRFAMTMGLPNTVAERATFRWTVVRTFAKDDASGAPLDWGTTATTTVTNPDVQVECAVEFGVAAAENTNVGTFDTSRAVITVLDEEFALLTVNNVLADRVLLGGNTYEVDYVGPPLGLFDVTVYQIYCKAPDES